jgi:hypothetical protein
MHQIPILTVGKVAGEIVSRNLKGMTDNKRPFSTRSGQSAFAPQPSKGVFAYSRPEHRLFNHLSTTKHNLIKLPRPHYHTR